MTRTGAGGRIRTRRVPGGPAGPVHEWPGDRQTRATSAARSAGSAGTRPPGAGHGGREAHRWSCGPAAGPERAGIRRTPPRGARPSGRPRWPRPPRASRRAARSIQPGSRRAAWAGRSAPRGRAAASALNSARARACPVSSLLSGAEVSAASTWLTACHRAGSPSGGTPQPPSREARSSSASTDRSLLGRSGLLLRSRLVMLPSKRRGGRMRYTAAIHACRGRDCSRRGSAGHAGLRQGRGQPP